MDEQTTPWPPRLPADERTRPVRRKRNLWPWFIFLLIVAGLVFWLHPWAKKAAGPHAGAAPPVAVAVAPVAPGSMDVVLTELGTVTPLATVTVQSQISGYLQQVNFKEGQEVAKGFLLALVDPRPYEVLLEQYTAQLARDTAALSQAQMDLTRYQTLGRQQSIAKQTLDDQKFTVAQDQATIKIDQSQIDNEKLNIAYCHITSPVDGRVGLRQVDAGNYVTSTLTNGLVVITQIKPISVIFTVAEDDIQPILEKLNGSVSLAVDAYDRTDSKKLATGSVETIDNQVDTSTGTVKLRANFPNADERLFPNEFVNAHLLLQTLNGVLIVPTPAIQNGPNGNFVYVVKTSTVNGHEVNKVAVANVKVGYAHGDRTVIQSGLASGDKVVIDGTDRLKDGAVVTIPGPGQKGGHGRHSGEQPAG
jgi:multidrug efflux system membrane fusion protein